MTFKHVLTLFIVLIGWVLFRSKDFKSAYLYLKNMFGLLPHSNEIFYTHTFYYDNIQIMAALLGILFSTPLIAKFFNRGESSELVKFCQNLSLIAIIILSSAFLTADTYNPFIYFRF
jgi:alginate O-acetyltransferase complex protein AlgI